MESDPDWQWGNSIEGYTAMTWLLILLAFSQSHARQCIRSQEYEINATAGTVRFVTFDQGQKKFLILAGADAAKFKVLSRSNACNHGYGGDGKKIYFQGRALLGVNSGSFRHLGADYAIAGKKIYFGDHPLPDADAGTFRMGQNSFAFDKNHVYKGEDRFPLSTYRESGQYSILGSKVWHEGRFLERADGGAFQIINEYYAKDPGAVYYRGIEVEGADPESFEALSLTTGRDKLGPVSGHSRIAPKSAANASTSVARALETEKQEPFKPNCAIGVPAVRFHNSDDMSEEECRKSCALESNGVIGLRCKWREEEFPIPENLRYCALLDASGQLLIQHSPEMSGIMDNQACRAFCEQGKKGRRGKTACAWGDSVLFNETGLEFKACSKLARPEPDHPRHLTTKAACLDIAGVERRKKTCGPAEVRWGNEILFGIQERTCHVQYGGPDYKFCSTEKKCLDFCRSRESYQIPLSCRWHSGGSEMEPVFEVVDNLYGYKRDNLCEVVAVKEGLILAEDARGTTSSEKCRAYCEIVVLALADQGSKERTKLGPAKTRQVACQWRGKTVFKRGLSVPSSKKAD